MVTRKALPGLLVFFSMVASAIAKPSIEGIDLPPASRGGMAEIKVALKANCENPYDPDEVALDALIRTPSDKALSVPGFYFEPFQRLVKPAESRLKGVRLLRFFISSASWRKNDLVQFVLDDVVLSSSRTGERVVLGDFEGEHTWQAGGVALAIEEKTVRSGKGALSVRIEIGEKPGWPGANLAFAPTDWSRFDTLSFWIHPQRGTDRGPVAVEFWTQAGDKFQKAISAAEGSQALNQWHHIIWKFAEMQDVTMWAPSGPGSWRMRFTPTEAGEHRLRLRLKDKDGLAESPERTFAVAEAPVGQKPDGFLRVDARDRRYLRFDSGRAYFAIGTNLLGRDSSAYDHYLPKFAAHGCNFIRLWMSPRTLGIETAQLGRYQQDRAAQFDYVLNLAQSKGVYVMACLIDFREADTGRHGYWNDVAYNAEKGGPCAKAEDFFTDETAKALVKKRLRYIVARWGACTAIHSWEFFNEVDITDAWRVAPDTVRAWHEEMAAYLRSIDPYGHLVTSSFAGPADDALWQQPLMEIAQRHFYTDRPESFAERLADATQVLSRHQKPVLVGEFGRGGNKFADIDKHGLSLHEGLWASTMAGGCGAAMPWWWEWIDQKDLYFHFAHLARFVEGVDFGAEGFEPLTDVATRFAKTPADGFEQITIVPTKGSWQPGEFNRPNTIAIGRDGTVDKPDLLASIIHGQGHHKDKHNPQTLVVDYPADGEFAVYLETASGHGGANLKIDLDGARVLEKDFVDDEPDSARSLDQYAGKYAIPVPRGKHQVTLTNTGKDWIKLRFYALSNYGQAPAVKVFGLKGKRTALAWAWNSTNTWHAPVYVTPVYTPRDVEIELRGLPKGKVTVIPFDTWRGRWQTPAEHSSRGDITLRVPSLERDLAFKVVFPQETP